MLDVVGAGLGPDFDREASSASVYAIYRLTEFTNWRQVALGTYA